MVESPGTSGSNIMWKRLRKFTLIGAITMPLVIMLFVFWKRPVPSEKREIFKGIHLQVKQLDTASGRTATLMLIEVHWNTPGVEIRNRPLVSPVDPGNPAGPHYRLANADWALLRTGADVLMNTTRYSPSNPMFSLPGMPVHSVETVVDGNDVSHVHEHSYLLYIDDAGSGHVHLEKPPTGKVLNDAVWGIGLQGVQIADGIPRYNALSDLVDEIPRSFIGMDPDRKILYLLAFDRIDGRTQIDAAISSGVKYGGQVDSGGSTSLLIGRGAKGVSPHTGMRGWRPLGGYLMVQAESLD